MRIDRELGLAVVLLAASLFFLVHLVRAPASDAGFVTTTTVPTALSAVLAVLAALLLFGALVRPAGTSTSVAGARLIRPDRAGPWRVVVMVAGTGLYVALMPWLGYVASSALYIAGLAWLYGTRNWFAIAALAAAVPFLLMIFFERYMIVLLPSTRLLD
jgi:hypothetical protein